MRRTPWRASSGVMYNFTSSPCALKKVKYNKNTYMKFLKFTLFILGFLFTSTLFADDLSSLQQKKLVSGLNYLQYSTAKIKMSENKAIAEDVYY